MSSFERVIQSLSRVLSWVAGLSLLGMMLITAVNVIVRPIYRPILGTPEVVEYGLVVVVCFGLACTAVARENVSVELLVSRFPKRAQAAIKSITCFLSMGTMGVIAWQSAVFGWEQQMIDERSSILLFPLFPLRYALVFGCIVLCLVLFLDLLRSLGEVIRR